MVIRYIDLECCNQITSSSLIPGPVSAIKELIDNAIDSGAKNIYLDIDQGTGGCEYMKARDDGSGVEGSSRPLMCLNHTTSKISSLQEMAQAKTLGFRGQALFTLASLSSTKGYMEVTTKCKKDVVGEKWIVQGNGSIKDSKMVKIPCLQGTTVIVRRLLAGLRARYLEYSQKPFKQIGKCKALIDHYSLEYRSIRFYFYLDTLDKNGVVVKRELQQSYDMKLDKVLTLLSISRLRDTHSQSFLRLKGLSIDEFTKIDVILPRTISDSDIWNIKKAKKFLSFNGRPLSLDHALGKSVNKMIDSLYHQLQLPDPMLWYMNFHTDMKIADVNIEPEKNDVLLKEVDFVLVKIKQKLFDYFCQELNIRRYGESRLIAEPSKMRDSPCKVKRSLTEGSMVSDEAEWTHTLLDDDDSDCQNVQEMADLPSSLTYNYRDSSFENEDLEISRELSISNPFITAKLRKSSNSCGSKGVRNRRMLQMKDDRDLISRSGPLNKIRKVNNLTKDFFIKSESDQTYEDTTFVGVEEDQNDQELIPERSIFQFSQFTNNYAIMKTFEISHYSSKTYKQEENWLLRGGKPSEWISTYMRTHPELHVSSDVYF